MDYTSDLIGFLCKGRGKSWSRGSLKSCPWSTPLPAWRLSFSSFVLRYFPDFCPSLVPQPPSFVCTCGESYSAYYCIAMEHGRMNYKDTKPCVRLPLQPTTLHWEIPPIAVRAIFAPVCHRRTARRLPNRIQMMFWRAALYSTIGIDWHKCTKRLKPENRKDPYK